MARFVITDADGVRLEARRVAGDAHWRWLALGWRDLLASCPHALALGAVPAVAALALTATLWRLDLLAFLPAACGGFALVGPALAIAAYEMSRRRAEGRPADWSALVRPRLAAPGQAALIGFSLFLILVLWGRLASLIYALALGAAPPGPTPDLLTFALRTPEGLAMLAFGSLVGGALAVAAFAISVVSMPLVTLRRVDAMTAMVLSCAACWRSRVAMAGFAFNIAMLTGLSLATGFLGLIVVFPWLGHAAWHAMRELVDEADARATA